MTIAGVIIAGGRSSRMGGTEKALLPFGGKPLLAHVIERLSPQVERLAINANGDAGRFSSFGLTVVADSAANSNTPLAGLEAALRWGQSVGADHLLTVPSDAPFLPHDLVQRLAAAGAPAMAASNGQDHYLTALWPVSLSDAVSDALRAGLRPVKVFASHCAMRRVEWAVENTDPFFNINTPDDLKTAEQELARTHA